MVVEKEGTFGENVRTKTVMEPTKTFTNNHMDMDKEDMLEELLTKEATLEVDTEEDLTEDEDYSEDPHEEDMDKDMVDVMGRKIKYIRWRMTRRSDVTSGTKKVWKTLQEQWRLNGKTKKKW